MPTRRAAVTLRAFVLGVLMMALIVGMTQILSLRYSAAEVAGNAPPPAPTYLLFLYVLLLSPLLRRLGRRFALTRGELLIIYMMMLIAGQITHPYAIGFMIPHIVSPYHFAAQEPGWNTFLPFLPAWLGPRDRLSVLGFFNGTGGIVPWGAWLVPLLAWASLLLALFCVMLCVNAIMAKQWIEHERLPFPLTSIPLALTVEDAGAVSGHPPLF
ncbi:MAG TPA: DUF6785 family protein, partial [Chthonomonadaceae bacterium]|nr:DUF6785 family protein [Chthonomonadaceae bacterium]